MPPQGGIKEMHVLKLNCQKRHFFIFEVVVKVDRIRLKGLLAKFKVGVDC